MEFEIRNAIIEQENEQWKAEMVSQLRSQFRYKTADMLDLCNMIATIDKKIIELTDDIEGLSSLRSSDSEAPKFMRKELARIQVGACKRLKKVCPILMKSGICKEAEKRVKKYAREGGLWPIILYLVIIVTVIILCSGFSYL